MADIKTHFRELSVIHGIILHREQLDFSTPLTSLEFYEVCEKHISNDITSAKNILDIDINQYAGIIRNGHNLAKLIIDTFPDISNDGELYWLGGDTQKDEPADIVIDDYSFSLKEDSFILENMGLYKYLNLITNANYKRGLHIFKEFSPSEFELWFNYTWNFLLKSGNWSMIKNGKNSSITINKDNVIFNFNGAISTIPNKTNLLYADFVSNTTSTTREKVFSKWIGEIIKSDSTYQRLKKECSSKAGENLVTLINTNLDPKGLMRFLRIHENEYFYGKSTSFGSEIYKVPSSENFEHNIKVTEVSYGVPASQLNLHTTIKNIKTDKELKIRNEIRYSHGQLNGTPEAKMYYGRDQDLTAIYERVAPKE